MSERNLDEAYMEALETSRRNGAVEELQDQQERRAYPRIRLALISGKGGSGVRSYLIDISASGACVCTREPANGGDSLHARHEEIDPCRLSVVNCRFSDFDHVMMVTYYHLGCEFENETEGKQLLVQVIEQGQENLRLERR